MDDQLLHVLGLFYDSVLDKDKWHPACEALSDFVGGTGVAFVVADPQAGVITHCETVGVDPDIREPYLNYYATREVRLPPAVKYPPGVVMTERMLIDQRELERSELYRDLLLPMDIPHFMFSWIKKAPTVCETLAVENSLKGGPFQADAIERYSLLLPHISRAIRMRDHLTSSRLTVETCLSVLDSVPYGVIFLDEHARVLNATSAALDILFAGKGLALFKSTIRAVERDDDRRLQRAIDRAVRTSQDMTVSGATLHIGRTSSINLLVYVIALTSCEHLTLVRRPSAMLLLIDPDATPRTDLQLIQRSLGLTQAEAILAHELFRGYGLREAAQTLGISVNTAKSQLKSIYSKTGAGSHADLARKIMTVSLAPSWSAATIF